MSAVLVYHLWPHQVTGGFVGVDVFFVISGFLITAHLLAHPPRRPVDLLQFWSRRIRRLLPASLLVLLVTLVGSRLFAPETQWANTAAQAKAAALYVVNWRLASDSVDYLAAENAPSPVQHFWSLSVEEQFYLGWPVLILLLVLLACRARIHAPAAVVTGLLLVVAASLAYSVYLTDLDPARAYFVTPTRVWELGIGGVLAALVSRRAFGLVRASEAVPLSTAARVALAWAGFAAIVSAIATYDASTSFPGWRALLPALGAAAVIAALAPVHPLSPGFVLSRRPVQWLGDVSYSVYLWHWPLIVLLPVATGLRGWLEDVIVIVGALLLAGLTKVFIEDRFRTARWGRPLLKPYVLAAAGMAVVVAGCALQTGEVHHREAEARQALQKARTSNTDCFGAAALGSAACPRTRRGTLTPDPIAAAQDKSHAYESVSHTQDCFSYLPSFHEHTCSFGDPSAAVRVALVGNSHAGQWVDAIDAIAKTQHWRVTTYLASQCTSSDVLQTFDTPAQAAACRSWTRRVTSQISNARYDLVIVANRISVTAAGDYLSDSQRAYESGYRPVLSAIRSSGAKLVGIRDTPAPGESIPDCLATHRDDYTQCDGTRATWLPADPLVPAIRALHDPGATVADLTDHICLTTVCPATTGGVPVYFDGSHLTSTYARTVVPYLAPYLQHALAH